MAKTDWRKTVDKDWIGCYILPDSGVEDTGDRKDKANGTNPYQAIYATLIKVELKTVNVKGKEEQHKVAYFNKNDNFTKPMLLSAKTNLERVEKLTGSRFIEDWGNINKKVILRAEWDKAFGGGKDWALRISLINEKPELKENTVSWTAVLEHVKKGNDPAKAREKYQISDVLFKKLEDARPKSAAGNGSEK